MQIGLIQQLLRSAPERPSINELRAEFQERALEGWLWPWLGARLMLSAFAHLKPRYSAQHYSPSARWDEGGVWELVHDFIVDRGIARGAIEMALARADSTTGLEKYLEAALHNYAITERRRDAASNVFHRLADGLATDARFRAIVGIGIRTSYGLEAWPDETPRMAQQDLRDAARFVPGDIRLIEYATGTRRSPNLSSRDLIRIAQAVLMGSAATWTAGQIMELITQVFALRDDDPVAAENGAEELARQRAAEPPLNPVVAEELATEALALLTDQQLRILRHMLHEERVTTRAIADRVDLSKSQVNNEQHRIRAVFSVLGLSTSEQREQVLSRVSVALDVKLGGADTSGEHSLGFNGESRVP